MDPYETDEDPEYEPEDESERDDDSKIQDEESRKTVKSKKRVKNEMEWQDKKRKRLRDSGKEYVGYKKKIHAARSVKPYNHSCRYHCNENITEEERKVLFDEFYSVSSYDLQNAFLSSCIKKKQFVEKKYRKKQKF